MEIASILHDVDAKKITHSEAANRIVELREQMDELLQQIKKSVK
ncbi:MAG TPA: hypothetical protein VGD40_02695 [Chryseosolibacter sp.]